MTVSADYEKLADAWDDSVLRRGDKAKRQCVQEPERAAHPNTIVPRDVLAHVFSTCPVKNRSGIHGTTHTHGMACCVARGAAVAQNEDLQELATDLDQGTMRTFVIARHYDCTPLKVTFGPMKTMLAPSARYLVETQVSG